MSAFWLYRKRIQAPYLARVLKGTPVGVDILVIGRDAYAKWRQIPRSIYWSIEQEGKSLDIRSRRQPS